MKEMVVNGVHEYTEEKNYVEPKSDEVKEHLEWFKDQKLGLMMHWSPGSQMGTYESWPLCDKAKKWSQEDIFWTDIKTFKEQYEYTPYTFNPVKFRPDLWAKWAKECGFKYLLCTTKHHDGFCMFDTKTTDYKITNEKYPFSKNKYADIIGSLFREFQKQGLGISAYFSKPDWHDNNYWHREFPPATTQSVNYDIKEYPDMWEAFVKTIREQMREICSNYGKIDVLWLDGGWVRPDNLDQDISLDKIVEEIRSTTQPHLIVADRTVGGAYENIVTPEQNVPEHAISVPWESCVTAGEHFSFHYDDEAKSGRELTALFLDILCKGGNLALNVTPRPDGTLPGNQVKEITDFGLWVQKHGEGIFDTRSYAPYKVDRVYFTQKEKEQKIYAFYLYDEIPAIHEDIHVPVDKNVTGVKLMRRNQQLKFRQRGNDVSIRIKDISFVDAFFADGFEITYNEEPLL